MPTSSNSLGNKYFPSKLFDMSVLANPGLGSLEDKQNLQQVADNNVCWGHAMMTGRFKLLRKKCTPLASTRMSIVPLGGGAGHRVSSHLYHDTPPL